MHARAIKAVFLLTLMWLLLQLGSQQPAAGSVDDRRDIQPILAKNCVGCHQGQAAPAEVKLDTPEGLPHGGQLSAEEIARVKAWINQGARAGDATIGVASSSGKGHR